MKICKSCHINKFFANFSKDKSRSDGYCRICKKCAKEYKARYYLNNIEELRDQHREYGKTHRAEQLKRNYKYKKIHLDKYRLSDNKRKKQDRIKNPDKYKRWHLNYLNKHPDAKMASRLRQRLCVAIKNGHKAGSAVNDLGCSIKQFKQYLSKQFQDGMTWKNYGEWQIDHILPLSHFNLGTRAQFLKACHYTNLQPLWKIDNLRKGNRIQGDRQ